MLLHRDRAQRRGATAVEFAIVGTLTFFLIFALVVGAMGIFRYQEVAHLAREGSRFAATHGGKYQLDGIATQTSVPAIFASSDMRAYLLPRSVALDASKLQVTVAWSPPLGATPTNMPTYVNTDPNLLPPGQKTIRNYVTVTVSYQWTPEMYLIGPITLTSTSIVPMSY